MKNEVEVKQVKKVASEKQPKRYEFGTFREMSKVQRYERKKLGQVLRILKSEQGARSLSPAGKSLHIEIKYWANKSQTNKKVYSIIKDNTQFVKLYKREGGKILKDDEGNSIVLEVTQNTSFHYVERAIRKCIVQGLLVK
jgi:hypothetical protein